MTEEEKKSLFEVAFNSKAEWVESAYASSLTLFGATATGEKKALTIWEDGEWRAGSADGTEALFSPVDAINFLRSVGIWVDGKGGGADG